MEETNINDLKVEFLPEEPKEPDLKFKVIIIGDQAVGKTCLSKEAIKNTFDEAYNATVGFEYLNFDIKIEDKNVKLQIWDTCGQEIYRSLITNYFREAALAIIVYSIDRRESFINLNTWLKEVHLLCNPDIKLFLIGNKVDLEDNREVLFEEAKKYAKENGFVYVNETSAKKGLNTKLVFIQAAKILYLEYLKYTNKGKIDENENIKSNNVKKVKINKEKEIKRDKGGCC